jgi:hypothetical protein
LKKLFINLDIDQIIKNQVKQNYRNAGVIQESYLTRYYYLLHKIFIFENFNHEETDAPINTANLAAILSLPRKDFHKILNESLLYFPRKYFLQNLRDY